MDTLDAQMNWLLETAAISRCSWPPFANRHKLLALSGCDTAMNDAATRESSPVTQVSMYLRLGVYEGWKATRY